MSHAEDVKPQVRTITLKDGVEREFCFTLNAMAELEIRFGSVENAFTKLQGNSIAALRYILWLCLEPDTENGLTEKQIGALIEIKDMPRLSQELAEIIQEALPQQDAADPNALSPATD